MRYSGLLVLVVFMGYVSSANAQVTTSDQQRTLLNIEQTQQKQENFLKNLEDVQERQIREKKRPKIEVPGEVGSEEAPEKPGEKEKKKQPCFEIKTIELKDATILKGKELNKITRPYANSCMGIIEINNLMRAVTNYYVDKDYVTARVAVPQQDMKSGNLQLVVIEGAVEDIILNENTFRDKAQVAMAFPFIKGKLLNLRDIEQGLDQLNRLSSSTATMQLVPGDKQGGTKVVITNNTVKPNRATIGYENSGQNSTGKNKAIVGLERDNLLGLGDAWSFNYNEDTAHSNEKGAQIYAGNFSLPFGYWTFSENVSHSQYKLTLHPSNRDVEYSGQTDSSNTKLDRTIYRSQDSKLSLSTGLKLKNTKAFQADAPLGDSFQTYSLSIWKAATDYTLRALDAIWNLGGGIERGLSVFGSTKDIDNLSASSPSAQFYKYTLDASVYKPFKIAKADLLWRTIISGQKSPDHLYPSERISLGDRYTVRGFDNSSISGDSGGYIKNELGWNLPQFTQNKYANFLVGNLQPYIGLDTGMTKLHLGKNSEAGAASGYVSGWAMGIRNNSEWLAFDLAYAQAINAPAEVYTKSGEVYFTVSTKIGF